MTLNCCPHLGDKMHRLHNETKLLAMLRGHESPLPAQGRYLGIHNPQDAGLERRRIWIHPRCWPLFPAA